ncbi:MAG: hypothetical protein HKN20_03080 [Gemmatimonadetes bacterium]|nr:hypothetical protein [Gemmatimonadota bacterium]
MTDADTNAASMVSEVGAIKGTLPYMSPEQARGNPDEIDLRTHHLEGGLAVRLRRDFKVFRYE